MTAAVVSPKATAVLSRDAAELAAGLPPLLIEAERVAASASFGVHGRRQAGPGEDFWQFRPYGTSDSTSTIDWRRSAKAGPVYVREREWQAAQTVALWCDTTSSMAYRSAKTLPLKQERAAVLSLALSLLLVDAGERISALPVQPEGTTVTTRQGVWRLGQHWTTTPATPDLPNPHRPLPRHTSVVAISDFLMPLDDIQSWLLRLTHGRPGAAHLLHIMDPAERDLPFTGRVRFDDAESDTTVLIKNTEAIRETYRGRLRDHMTTLATMASKHGWSHSVHTTDHQAHVPLIGLFNTLTGAGKTSRASGALDART